MSNSPNPAPFVTSREPSQDAEARFLLSEIFNAIQGDQGNFHISDGEDTTSRDALFQMLRWRLRHGKAAVRKLRAFLKKHGEL
jgi:hypothetical protein